MKEVIAFTLNGAEQKAELDPERPLLWVLRSDFGLIGTKYGCGIGMCGSCTVLLDGEAVRSCQLTVGEVAGRRLTTIEGLAEGEQLHPVQQAFMEHDALQCGYCTPGMIMQTVAFLQQNPKPDEKQVKDALEDNLCRCGAHNRIVKAVLHAARLMHEGGRS